MVLRLLCLLLLLLTPALTHAQCPGVTTPQTPFASETLTISDTIKPLTASIYKPAGTTPTMAVVSVEGAPVRYFTSGTPSATTGHPLAAPSTTFLICGLDSLSAFKAIRSTATDAQLTATYFKNKSP